MRRGVTASGWAVPLCAWGISLMRRRRTEWAGPGPGSQRQPIFLMQLRTGYKAELHHLLTHKIRVSL